MAIEGPLKELGIHDVFQLLDLSRKTGVLRVTSQLRRNQGTIHFDNGAVVYAEVQSNPHPFGALLVRSGKVSESDVQRARDMQERGDQRRLGEILVDLSIITEREMESQVRFQVEEVIFEITGWSEGYFSFHEGPLTEVRADAIVRIPTEALLMEGARRIDEWSRIEHQIPHLGVVPSLAPAASGEEGELDLLPPEWEVLATIDGQRDLRAIAHLLGRSEFDVAKTVFGLQSANVLSTADPGRRSMPEVERSGDLAAALTKVEALLDSHDFEGARAEVEAVVAALPGEPMAYLGAARVHLAAGHAKEAEESTRRALRLDQMLALGHRLLGDALVTQGRFAEAAEWWERWLTLDEHDVKDLSERERITSAREAALALDSYLRSTHGR